MLPAIDISSEEIFLQHNTLPPLPQIISRLQQLLQSDDINIAEISRLVENDVALSAQILKIVNSSYFGLRKEISNMKIAIAFLGINEINRIILTVSVVSALKVKNEKALKDFWYHSYYSAICSKLLASKFAHYMDPEELGAAALLHDLGSLVYLKYYPEHYDAASSLMEENGILRSQAEKELGIPPSATFGSILCTFWKLPATVKTACENHTIDTVKNISNDDKNADFKKLISLGSLCSSFTSQTLNKALKKEIVKLIMNTFSIDRQEFLLLLGEIRDKQAEVNDFVKTIF